MCFTCVFCSKTFNKKWSLRLGLLDSGQALLCTQRRVQAEGEGIGVRIRTSEPGQFPGGSTKPCEANSQSGDGCLYSNLRTSDDGSNLSPPWCRSLALRLQSPRAPHGSSEFAPSWPEHARDRLLKQTAFPCNPVLARITVLNELSAIE